jgi:hypothetical protein
MCKEGSVLLDEAARNPWVKQVCDKSIQLGVGRGSQEFLKFAS